MLDEFLIGHNAAILFPIECESQALSNLIFFYYCEEGFLTIHKEDCMSLGKRIVERRMELGLDQADLVRLSKVKQGTLSKYENDKVESPKTPLLLRIAAALETTPEYLMHGTGQKNLHDATGSIQELLDEAKKKSPDALAMLLAAAKALPNK